MFPTFGPCQPQHRRLGLSKLGAVCSGSGAYVCGCGENLDCGAPLIQQLPLDGEEAAKTQIRQMHPVRQNAMQTNHDRQTATGPTV